MKKNKLLLLFFILFATFFMIPSIFLFGNFTSHFKNQSILSNGIETEARVIKDSYSSNIAINGVNYYSIEFEFYDTNNQKHGGRTSPAYTLYEIRELVAVGYVTIKYDANTFDAIEATYSLAGGNSGNITIFIIFTAVDLILWGVVIAIVIKRVKKRRIELEGTEYTANFVSYASGMVINNVPMFYINYTWTNKYGEIKEGRSGSDYTLQEASIFESVGEFKIKAKGDDSVITSNPSQLLAQNSSNIKLKNDSEITCVYCGSVYNKSFVKCPTCGANKRR